MSRTITVVAVPGPGPALGSRPRRQPAGHPAPPVPAVCRTHLSSSSAPGAGAEQVSPCNPARQILPVSRKASHTSRREGMSSGRQAPRSPRRASSPGRERRWPAMCPLGWAARRGPVFMLREPRPFPCSLPPNPACGFHRTGLSSDLCRVLDGVCVDAVMARRADNERLAPHFRHESRPRGLARSRFPELAEPGDLVDCHRGAGFA